MGPVSYSYVHYGDLRGDNPTAKVLRLAFVSSRGLWGPHGFIQHIAACPRARGTTETGQRRTVTTNSRHRSSASQGVACSTKPNGWYNVLPRSIVTHVAFTLQSIVSIQMPSVMELYLAVFMLEKSPSREMQSLDFARRQCGRIDLGW